MDGVNNASQYNGVYDDSTTNSTNSTSGTSGTSGVEWSEFVNPVSALIGATRNDFLQGDAEGLENTVGMLVELLGDENTSEEDKAKIHAHLETLQTHVDDSGDKAMQDSFYAGLKTGAGVLKNDSDASIEDIWKVGMMIASRPTSEAEEYHREAHGAAVEAENNDMKEIITKA